MTSAIGMASVMAIMAAMLAIDTKTSGIVAAVMLFAYQAFYTWGFMGGIWVRWLHPGRRPQGQHTQRIPMNIANYSQCYGPEILPLAHRSKGVGLANAFLWLSTFVVIEIVPIAIDHIGWRTYIIFAAFNLAFIPMIYFLYPETAGFSLEAVDLSFMDPTKSPVARADELWKLIRQGHDVTLTGEAPDHKEGLQAEHVEMA